MHRLIESIEIRYTKDEDKVDITVTNTEDLIQTKQASVTKNGTFRFSCIHPEDNKKYSYQGVFHPSQNRVIIYPIIGKAVLSHQPIEYEQL